MAEWKGYYVQFGQQFPMEFADLQINIASAQPGVSGSGADIVGNFTLQGSYDSSSSAIKFTKQYEGAHAIYYEGTLSASQTEITGYWGFEPGQHEEPFKLFK